MVYQNIVKGTFVSRPNRFIAHVLVNGSEEIAHVKNTGRCRELLISGVTVYLEPSQNPSRKTKFSLVAVEKDSRLINMDSQAPNKILGEALAKKEGVKGFPFPLALVKPEFTYKDSRLDFMLKHGDSTTLVEVKGVTLENDGVVLFPDAPTIRGVKHLETLITAKKEGYGAVSCFIIQMNNVKHFSPNNATHPQFGEALVRAAAAGVEILAFDCSVTPNSIVLGRPVPVVL